jgi:hypothetical protein
MIPIAIKITFTPPMAKWSRKLREVTREAHRVEALAWHRMFAPLHFNERARHRYGYKRRNAKYIRRKAKLGFGIIDLIYSRLTVEKVLRPPMVKAFPTRATLVCHSPSYIKMRPHFRDAPALAKEITTVIPTERRALGKVLRDEVVIGLRKIKDTRTVHIEV